MAKRIDRLTIKGFKSIRSLESFRLRELNILIGANGAGKSNFVSFFSFLREMVEGRLALTVNKGGGADAHLFLGPQITKKIGAELHFGLNGYVFELEPTVDNRLVFGDERIQYVGSQNTFAVNRSLGSGQSESNLKEQTTGGKNQAIAKHIYEAVSGWVAYHFHDTSETAPMRRTCSVRDNERLRPDAGNLAAFLFRLKEEKLLTYELICDTVRLVAPFFKEFRLRPKKATDDEIVQLEWTQKNSDHPFHAGQFSDGTIRFIALATALLQPDPPATILIDEPELGLHPYALNTLASLIRQARQRTQLIVSTQSAGLLNAFEPKDIVVIDRREGESQFHRLSEQELGKWLEEKYNLGELWQKEVYGGGPVHE
jgi:predicted ATPase